MYHNSLNLHPSEGQWDKPSLCCPHQQSRAHWTIHTTCSTRTDPQVMQLGVMAFINDNKHQQTVLWDRLVWTWTLNDGGVLKELKDLLLQWGCSQLRRWDSSNILQDLFESEQKKSLKLSVNSNASIINTIQRALVQSLWWNSSWSSSFGGFVSPGQTNTWTDGWADKCLLPTSNFLKLIWWIKARN